MKDYRNMDDYEKIILPINEVGLPENIVAKLLDAEITRTGLVLAYTEEMYGLSEEVNAVIREAKELLLEKGLGLDIMARLEDEDFLAYKEKYEDDELDDEDDMVIEDDYEELAEISSEDPYEIIDYILKKKGEECIRAYEQASGTMFPFFEYEFLEADQALLSKLKLHKELLCFFVTSSVEILQNSLNNTYEQLANLEQKFPPMTLDDIHEVRRLIAKKNHP